MDGHRSHTALKSIETAKRVGIILVILYPNATRIIQMADKVMFKPIKTAWNQVMSEHRRNNPNGNFLIEGFAPSLKIANDRSISPELIRQGFHVTGWCPFNKNNVDFSWCIANSPGADVPQQNPSNATEESDGKTPKGKRHLVDHNEFLYRVTGVTKGIAYCECEDSCGVKAKIVDGLFSFIRGKSEHTHGPDQLRINFLKVYEEMKQSVANNPRRSVFDLYQETTRDICDIKLKAELAWSKVKTTLQRIRRQTMPPCRSRADLMKIFESKENIRKSLGTVRGRPFYAGCVGPKKVESALFINPDVLERVQHMIENGEPVHLFADATFNILPLDYNQLFVVQALIDDRTRPLMYALMVRKDQLSYWCVFDALKRAAVKPTTLMMDFELAARKAAEEVWTEDFTLNGCYFHFSKAINKKASELGLFQSEKEETHMIVRCFMRLALLPLDRVDAGIEQLKGEIRRLHLWTKFRKFLLYFGRTWSGRYKQVQWNVRVLMHRTNNFSEAMNAVMKRFMKRKPNVYEFLEALHKLVDDAAVAMLVVDKKKKPRKDLSRLTEPLQVQLELLQNGDITELEFLKALADVKHLRPRRLIF